MAAFDKLSQASADARRIMQTPSEDPYMVFRGETTSSLADKDECSNPDCTYCGSEGECIFETCQIEELPKVDKSYKFKCILCDEEQDADPMSVQGRARLCDDCIEKLLETHQIKEDYVCVLCNRASSDTRKIFGANICNECTTELFRTHQTMSNFKCIICDKSTKDTRKIFGVNMCDECFEKLKSRILYW